MQKCSWLAQPWLKHSSRLSFQTVKLSSTSKVHISDNSVEDPSDDSKSHINMEKLSRRDYRYVFPEFLPDPNPSFRNTLSERLQRKDMIARREVVEIPEFYVGTIMAVTISDAASPHPNKLSRFVGICIDRGGCGLRAWFTLRNVVDGMGVEFMYNMYSPTINRIEVLRLERRLDDELYYLRDAPLQYSTVPFDMEPEILPEGAPVPLNDLIVPLNPKPWLRKWENLQA